MPVKKTHREQVKALATGDASRANELNEAMPDSERQAFNRYLSAVFAILLEHRFKDNLSRDAIAAFANEMVHDYEDTDIQIKPLTIEGVIRAASGEHQLADELSGEDILSTKFLVIGKIVMHDPEVSANLDGFLDEAEQLVDDWEHEE